jgi:hypothetical protein
LRLQGQGVSFVAAMVVAAVFAVPAGAATVTVLPAANHADTNCLPFGRGTVWPPYGGFVYKNIPAFALAPGDTIAFDTTDEANDTDIRMNVALAATTSNGSDVPAGPYTQVVPNTELALYPRGDNTPDDFDLKFTAQAPFVFSGGGLVIRFSNPAGAFATDSICQYNLGGAYSTDSSGFFVKRFYGDADGVPPWDVSDGAQIGAFQIVTAPKPPATNTQTTTPPADTTKPALGALGLSVRVFRAAKSGPSISAKKKPVGTKVSLNLSEPSSVRFTVERKTQGRKVGKNCVAQTRSNRKKKACVRWVKVKGSFTRAGKAGKNTFKFRGRIGGKALKPGNYRLDGQATDPAKNKSTTKRRSFKIVR